MNTRYRKILDAIFRTPTTASLAFSEIEALILHLDGQVQERQGSRVKLLLGEHCWRCHRPHPGKEAKRYQIEEAREFLLRAGIRT
ncbi:type II toxin-antitoxin system HicA family toxin [Pseudomonas putida]|uniref:type II toxin-antitoxin system HicA family toxin n=1 Tax=Pseudomonas putida TaxID=303 RepID=UPI00157560AD|nr:type II toxin-antitoxin system HicA family toxin [Pseudomonas putida]MCC9005986.1 type II toxin-antitoxin system HicA family toxin [Pseudomonas putida]NTY95218.1 type II toxin-antitoxin system HicA family toxin [Pseudomonas putida]NTZ03611.1 type II toxin-antitoxin system HicA family toxin [Pseudomonas putida]NTZ25897.1 type II toxin-antitoxin system HicA family toxin [Pseudomonas putida]NTZ58172.1 type II toxin-antitoxin system HicA family toxin [Pseudomonas putida]